MQDIEVSWVRFCEYLHDNYIKEDAKFKSKNWASKNYFNIIDKRNAETTNNISEVN
jgi:hypothetical protein